MTITTLATPTYARRETFAAMDSSNRLYLLGDIFTTVIDYASSYPERYDPSTGAWTILAQPPKKLYQNAFILDSSDRYIATGLIVLNLASGTAGAPPDSFLYNPSSDSWTTLADSPSPASAGNPWVHFHHNDQLYIAGPTSASSAASQLMHHYSGGTGGSWSSGSSHPPVRLDSLNWNIRNPYGTGGPIDSSGVFYMTAGPSTFQGVVTYNPSSDTWSSGATAPVAMSGGCWDGDHKIYFFSGSSFYSYDMTANSWTTLASFPIALGLVFGFAASTTLVVVPGYRNSSTVSFRNIYVYDIATNLWSDTGEVTGTSVSGGPRAPVIIKDPVGAGFYFVEGPAAPIAFEGSQVVEYWQFGTAPELTVTASFGLQSWALPFTATAGSAGSRLVSIVG